MVVGFWLFDDWCGGCVGVVGDCCIDVVVLLLLLVLVVVV